MSEDRKKHEGMTALVVDDEQESVTLMRRMLEKMGFDVEEALSASSALRITEDRGFDILVVDVSMPGMNGIDFMREAKAQGVAAPVIMVTAQSSVATAVAAIKAGAFEFLEKPLQYDTLAGVVRAALDARRSVPPVPGRNASQLSLGIEGKKRARRKSGEMRHLPASSVIGGRRHAIGRYEMLNPIGRGGMGVVYRCSDPLSGDTVAVKILQVYAETPQQREEMSIRFKREAAATKALAHPHIVRIHEHGFDDRRGEWYIAMELLEGRGLHVILASRGGLKTEAAVPIAFQMADALAYAHRHKVVHRDIKPSNVHVRPDGEARLLDFGLAAMEGWEITLTGRVFGSPSYMAPERINGETGGPPADQFSLGVVLYESITGRNPFDSEIPEAKLRKVLKHHPPTLIEKDPSIPPGLSHIIARMMEKKVTDRYPSMDRVADEFQSLGHTLGMDLVRHEPA